MSRLYIIGLYRIIWRDLCTPVPSRFVAEDYPWNSRSATFIVTVQICHCVNGQCDTTQLQPGQRNGSDVYRHLMCNCNDGWIGKIHSLTFKNYITVTPSYTVSD